MSSTTAATPSPRSRWASRSLRSRRGERWAGYFVVAVILSSALLALVEVIDRLLDPQTPTHLWALFVAGTIVSAAFIAADLPTDPIIGLLITGRIFHSTLGS